MIRSVNIVQRLVALPGVEDSALTGLLPLEGSSNVCQHHLGRPARGDARFETYRPAISVLSKSRSFVAADSRKPMDGALPVAIIDGPWRASSSPTGTRCRPARRRRRIGAGAWRTGSPDRRDRGDVRTDALSQNPNPAVYVPSTQRANTINSDPRSRSTRGDRPNARTFASLDSAIERELRGATGGLPVSPLRRMEEIVAQSTAAQNFNMSC